MQATTYYCPNCGQPLTIEGIQELPRGTQIAVTCRYNSVCKVRRATTTITAIQDGMFQSCWGFITAFNYLTGEPINDRAK